jgi:hypothetical protein
MIAAAQITATPVAPFCTIAAKRNDGEKNAASLRR